MAAFAVTQAIIDGLINCAIYTPAGVKVTTPQTVPVGTITLRTNTGYRFVGTPTIRWRYNNQVTQSGNFTGMNADKTQCQFALQASSAYVYNLVTAVTEAIPAPVPGTYTVVQTMLDANTAAHCKLYKGGALATLGTVFAPTDTFTLTPDSGYKITGAGFQDMDTGDYLGFTIAPDGSTATFINSTSAEIQDFAYGVTGEELPVGAYTFTQTDLNTCTAAQAKMYKGATLATAGMVFLQTDEFKLVANAGRLLVDGGVYFRDSGSGSLEPFTVAPDRLTATYVNTYGAVLSGLTVATTAAPVSNHTISQGDLDMFSEAHANLFVNGSPAVVGTLLYAGDTLRATTDEGWVFYQNPDAADGFVSIYIRYSNTGDFNWFEREGDTYVAADWVVTDYGPWVFYSVATVAEQPEGVKGFNNVYEINDDQLKLITQSRFVSPPDGGEQIDYGKYMLGLIELPFTINPDMVVTQQAVQLGPFNTGIEADYLNSDTIILNVGNIEVVGTKRNFLDYKNTNAILHLPYADPIQLELEYVIDQTISIQYQISLYDGTAIVNIESTKTGEVFYSKNIDLNIKIPFANINTYPAKNNPDSVELGGDNGVYTAFIELLRNDAVLESGFFTVPIVDEKPLTGYTGFARVEEINLSSKATSYEKDLIVNKLNAGVIIK